MHFFTFTGCISKRYYRKERRGDFETAAAEKWRETCSCNEVSEFSFNLNLHRMHFLTKLNIICLVKINADSDQDPTARLVPDSMFQHILGYLKR